MIHEEDTASLQYKTNKLKKSERRAIVSGTGES